MKFDNQLLHTCNALKLIIKITTLASFKVLSKVLKEIYLYYTFQINNSIIIIEFSILKPSHGHI